MIDFACCEAYGKCYLYLKEIYYQKKIIRLE